MNKAIMNIESILKIKRGKIGGNNYNALVAIDLYKTLKSKTRYNDWIIRRFDENPYLQEGEDYEIFHKKTKTSQGGRPQKDYLVTIRAAKKIAMAERTDIGNQVQEYFLACEEELKHQKEMSMDIVAVEKQFRAAKSIAKDLGFKESDAIDKARELVLSESNIDIYRIFTDSERIVYEKHHVHTAAQIAKKLSTRQRQFKKWQIEDALLRALVLRNLSSSNKNRQLAPSGVAERSRPYVYSYNPDTGFLKYTDLAVDLAYVVLTGTPADWDMENHKPREIGQKRLLK